MIILHLRYYRPISDVSLAPTGETLVQHVQSKSNHTVRTRLGFGIAQLQWLKRLTFGVIPLNVQAGTA